MIYSLPRCGSTRLLRLLNRHLGGERIVDEPFNPVHRARYVGELPRTVAELSIALERLGSRYWGFKQVWKPDGWPFEQPELNQALLADAQLQVVLLIRRNLLQRRVSEQISEQLQLWHPLNADEQRRFETHAYQPLDFADLVWWIENEPRLLADCRHRLHRAGKPWLEVAYEDLYGPAADSTPAFASLCAWLGLPPLDPGWLQRQLHSYPRTNSPRTYRRIPQIELVEALLGSAETGYLFR